MTTLRIYLIVVPAYALVPQNMGLGLLERNLIPSKNVRAAGGGSHSRGKIYKTSAIHVSKKNTNIILQLDGLR